MSTEALAKEAVILKLFRLYRSMDGKASRALTEAYLDPVKEYSLSAIQQAFERFRDNEVAGVDANYAINVPQWVSQVKMLDSILKRVRSGPDGLIVYRMGELPPPGTEPLGPIKIEINGIPTDVSHLTFAEKEIAMKTGRLPTPDAIGAPDRPAIEARLQKL